MSAGRDSPIWCAGVVALAAPFLALLCLTLWQTPYPLSEGVALLEDVARNPAVKFLSPDTSYYRPLFHITLSTIWNNAGSLEAAIGWIKLLQIVPVLLLATLFLVMARPRSAVDAGASLVALAVLTGSPSFRDNLEIPLSYTTMGMPAALAVWLLLERPWRRWHGVAILALTALAVGFKEQGLVIVPVVAVAWWAGAPGVRRGTALVLMASAAVYVGVRLSASGAWPLFQQDIGYGFARLSTEAAEQRFGAFPLWIFAYNALSTIANVLFAEPTAGVFRITDAIAQGRWSAQDVATLTSSMAMTGLIVWWASGAVRRALTSGWSPDARLVAVTVVALAACGALSFNYSRDRLGGMAIVFYAVAAWCALRAAALRAVAASRILFPISIAGLLLLAGAWQVRQLETLEIARDTASKNVREWLTDLPERRFEFRDRPTYLRIMESGVAQGTDLSVTGPTRYRRLAAWIVGRR
jgi:hypothetical protein